MPKKVVIIGAGNVAFHLTEAMLQNTVNVVQIFNRTLDNARKLAGKYNISFTDKISELERANVYIICTSDKAISEISCHIPFEDCLVVHTSGSMPISALKGKYRKGGFYPFQTFSKKRALKYDKIPFFIETENREDELTLFTLARRISGEVYKTDYEKRLQIHMSGVWVNNFTNHLYHIAHEICEKHNISFDNLKPLIKESADKIIEGISPFEAQTGPAKRNDKHVVEKHLSLLEPDSRLYQIYSLITDSITKTYHDKL
ncbi:MAG: DUF2520 domain-containing protein [Flavobacteriaceae bacterium]|jgi:predicted short-subunit dehydrogenase-like oxidoreductase (DUF2520 family)|nr:DUF2520 domain-containing protein [Flavobacteriaceae bacterium]